MDFKKYVSDYYQTKNQNKTLKFVVVIIALAVVVNSIAVIYSFNSHTTVIIPTTLDSKATIKNNTASASYLKAMGSYIIELQLNFTPDTAESQFAELLNYYDPSGYASAKTALYSQVQTIKTGKISQSFYITNVQIKDDKIIIDGIENRYTDVESLSNNKIVRYIITYKLSDGQFYVISIAKAT